MTVRVLCIFLSVPLVGLQCGLWYFLVILTFNPEMKSILYRLVRQIVGNLNLRVRRESRPSSNKLEEIVIWEATCISSNSNDNLILQFEWMAVSSNSKVRIYVNGSSLSYR